MIYCAHSEQRASGSTLSGDCGTAHSIDHCTLQRSSHSPIDFQQASIEDTCTGYTDPPFTVYRTYSAPESTNQAPWHLEAVDTHPVMDGNCSFMWNNPGSHQTPKHYSNAVNADGYANLSAAPQMVVENATPRAEANSLVDGSCSPSQTSVCFLQPYEALSAAQQVACHSSYATIDPSILVYRFPCPLLIAKEHRRGEHPNNASANVVDLPSGVQIPDNQVGYLQPSSKFSSSITSTDKTHLP